MKRSGFRRKAKIGDGNGRGAPPNRSQVEFELSRGILRAPRHPLKRSGRLKAGRKTNRWNSVRAQLKKRFANVGVTSCEFTFPHECWRGNGLSFAHSRKRNDPEFDIYECALACPQAHQMLDERMSHEEMLNEVQRTINARAYQP